MILDTRLTWSPHIDEVRKKATQMVGKLCPPLNTKFDFFVRNEVLLYKRLNIPMMYYACPAWITAAHKHFRRLPLLHSK